MVVEKCSGSIKTAMEGKALRFRERRSSIIVQADAVSYLAVSLDTLSNFEALGRYASESMDDKAVVDRLHQLHLPQWCTHADAGGSHQRQ